MKSYGFNLKHQNLIDEIESPSNFALGLLRNKVLLTGNAAIVERFYKETVNQFTADHTNKCEQSANTNSFWSNVGEGNARVFFGITKMINDAFVRLITSGGFTATVLDGESEHEALTERLNHILEKNSFKDRLWGLGESFQSGLGFAPFKISLDTDYYDVPIIEVIDPLKTECIMRRGRVVGYKFKKRVEYGETDYEVQEIIQWYENVPMIEYKVLDVNAEKHLNLKEIDTSMLEGLSLDFLDDNGKRRTKFDEFSQMSDLPVVLKNNTAYNSFFPNSPFGEPDTAEMHTIEDALSEVISSMVEEIRKGAPFLGIDESLVDKDSKGDPMKFNPFRRIYQTIRGSGNFEDKLSFMQGKINSNVYMEAAKALIMQACNKANIHPVTVGLTGLESIAASSESQQEREKVSLRTRELKMGAWREAFEQLFNLVLQADDIMNNRSVQEYDINVEFRDLTNPNPESIISLLGLAVQNGVMSIAEAQKVYHDDKTDEELEFMYLETLVEKHMPLTIEQRNRYRNFINDAYDYTRVEIPENEGV